MFVLFVYSITLSVLVHNVPAEVDLARPVYSAHLLLLLAGGSS